MMMKTRPLVHPSAVKTKERKERDKVAEYGTIVKGSRNQKGKEEGETR